MVRIVFTSAPVFLLAAQILLGSEPAHERGVVVNGIVRDASGGVIPQCKVKLTNGSDTKERKTTASNGEWTFADVPPGDYVLRAESAGFQVKKLPIHVDTGAIRNVQLNLDVVTQNQSVTVYGGRKQEDENVNSERNADQLSFEKSTLESLPSPDQNPLPLIANFAAPASQGAEGLNVLVDGVEMSAANLPARSIRRVRVNQNPYSVRYRRPGKGRVEVLTEEGSMRRLRGGFSYAARNSVFDSRNTFATTKPDLDRRMFDGNFTAPLVKQKATFFINAERLIDNETGVVNALTLNGPFKANVNSPGRRTNVLTRFDFKPSETHTITMLYSFRNEGENNRDVGGFKLPELGIPDQEQQHRFQMSDSSVLSQHLINDFRIAFDQEDSDLGRLTTDPLILVKGAFESGGPQSFLRRNETGVRIADIATFYRGRHSVLFGGEIRPAWFDATDRSNFGGTFVYSGLDEYAANRPLLFTLNRGNPAISFRREEASAFAQDEVRVTESLTMTAGLRFGWQSDAGRGSSVAPRLSLAYALPDRKTVLRAGAGWFYERVSDEVTRDGLLFDGIRMRQLFVSSPVISNITPAFLSSIPSSVVRIAPDLQVPAVFQTGLAVERNLWKQSTLTVEFQNLRGTHSLRSRDLNAPLPDSALRPNPEFLNIREIESAGALRGNALTVTWRGAVNKWFTGMGQYVFSKTEDNTSGPFFLPANNLNYGPEWGRSNLDQRHRFNLAGTANLPKALRLGLFVTLGSGLPYDITTGHDDNSDTVDNDRPAGFTRNTGNGPGLARMDVRFTKLLNGPRLFERNKEHSSHNVELSIDAFNVFNHVNFSNYVGVQTSPFFGHANSALSARTIQLSLHYRL